MWPFKADGYRYEKVASDVEQKRDLVLPTRRESPPHWFWVSSGILVALAILISISVLAILGLPFTTSPTNAPSPTSDGSLEDSKACFLRREWRTLPAGDQQSYITAVLCLLNTSSTLFPTTTGKTAYTDFPWIHSRVGYFTHSSAPFLPWHRYFLHIYETTLRSKCGYQGTLPYWDWTLDSDAVENSPVFDPDTGFGGDGEVGGKITVSNSGRCVVDGPFAGVQADYYDVKYMPHCLSRGFRDLEGNLGHIDGSDLSPQSIEEVLSVEGYEKFVTLMESRVHDAIP